MKVVCISNGEWDHNVTRTTRVKPSFTVGKVYEVSITNKYYYQSGLGPFIKKIPYYEIKEDDLGHKGYHCVQSLFSELRVQRKEKLNKLKEL